MSVMVRTGFVIASVLLVCCLTSFLSVLLLCLIIIVCSLCVYFYPGYNTLRASFEPLTQRLKSEVPIVFTKNFDKINDKLNYRMNTANLSKSFSSPTVKLRQSSSLSRSASFKEKENLSVLNNSRSYLTTSTFFKNKPESLKGSVLKRSSTFHAGSALLSSPLLPRVRRGATADEHIRLRDASRPNITLNGSLFSPRGSYAPTYPIDSSPGLLPTVRLRRSERPQLNRSLNSPGTVKIAPPDPKLQANRFRHTSESYSEQKEILNKQMILSALKETRKRAIQSVDDSVTEEVEDQEQQLSKRRKQSMPQVVSRGLPLVPSPPREYCPEFTAISDFCTIPPNIASLKRPALSSVEHLTESSKKKSKKDSRNNPILSSLSSSKRATMKSNDTVPARIPHQSDTTVKRKQKDDTSPSESNKKLLKTEQTLLLPDNIINQCTPNKLEEVHEFQQMEDEDSELEDLEQEKDVSVDIKSNLKKYESMNKPGMLKKNTMSLYSGLKSAYAKVPHANVMASPADYELDREQEQQRVLDMLSDIGDAEKQKEGNKADYSVTVTTASSSDNASAKVLISLLQSSTPSSGITTATVTSISASSMSSITQEKPNVTFSPAFPQVPVTSVSSSATTTTSITSSSQSNKPNFSFMPVFGVPAASSAMNSLTATPTGQATLETPSIASEATLQTSATGALAASGFSLSVGQLPNVKVPSSNIASNIPTGVALGVHQTTNNVGLSQALSQPTHAPGLGIPSSTFGQTSSAYGSLNTTSAPGENASQTKLPSMQVAATSTPTIGGFNVATTSNSFKTSQAQFGFGNTTTATVAPMFGQVTNKLSSTPSFTQAPVTSSSAFVQIPPVYGSMNTTSAPGFAFGTATATTTVASSGFSFGAITSQAQANNVTGFAIPAAATTVSSFAISTSTTNRSAKPDLTFGNASGFTAGATVANSGITFDTHTATTTAVGGMTFGAPAATTTAGGGMTFGAPAATATAVGGMTFGVSAATTTAVDGMTFGAPAATTTAVGGMTFGAPAATTTAVGSMTFGASAATTTAVGGMTFGAPAATTTAGGFGFATSVASSTTNSPFAFGGSVDSNADQISVNAPASLSSGFSFGTAAATAAGTGFGFGSSAASTTNAMFGSSNTLSVASGNLFNSQQSPAFGAVTTQAVPSVFPSSTGGKGFNFSSQKSTNMFDQASAKSQPSTMSDTTGMGAFNFAPTSSLTVASSSGGAFGGNGSIFSTPPATKPPMFGAATPPRSNTPKPRSLFPAGKSTPVFSSATPNPTGFGASTSFGTPQKTVSSVVFGAPTKPTFGGSQTAAVPIFGGVQPLNNTMGVNSSNQAGQQSSSVFGQSATATNQSGTVGFSFGQADQSLTVKGFDFTSSAPANPTLSFGTPATFGSPAASQTVNPNTSFGQAAPGIFSLGSGSAAPKPRLTARGRRRGGKR